MRNLALDSPRPKDLVRGIREVSQGRTNNVGRVTLTPSATTTVITRRGVAAGDHVPMSPETAAARTAYLAGMYWVATKDTITITHASNASTTQTFTYSFWGV